MIDVLASSLVQMVFGFTVAAIVFGIGWVARGERERQLRTRRGARRRAVVEERGEKARTGTKPARVSRATLDRGKVVQPDE